MGNNTNNKGDAIMRAIRVGILKCIHAMKWVLPIVIDRVLPYQFLSNQLNDCTHDGDQFECPSCRRAIEYRIAKGRVTVHGVAHRIAMFEASRDWKITYFEMYPAVKEALYRGIDRHVAYNSKEGTYHKVLRKGADMLNKTKRWIGLAVLTVGVVHLAAHHALPAFNEYWEDQRAHDAALYEDTRWIPTASGGEKCCNRCNYTVFDKSYTEFKEGYAHGHEVIINPDVTSSKKYVRTCSLR